MNLRPYYVLAPIVVLLAAFTSTRRQSDYIALDRDANPLRAAFNGDSGKIRVLMLVAPT